MRPAIIAFFRSYNLLFLSGMCLLFSVLTGCSDDDDDELPPTPISYTTLIYMAADNTMDSDVDYSISQLKAGAKRSAGTAVVYVDRMDEAPRLFKITQAGEEVALKSYEEENSANVETLVRVIEETKELIPSEKFGLVLWSHSMGWVPSGYSHTRSVWQDKEEQSFPRTRYIGPDFHPGNVTADVTIEIDALAAGLPDHVADYIWFDVCLMGSVEALYELRYKSDYLVASPTVVLAERSYDASGIPYAKVLPYMFGGVEELKQACNAYYQHYNGMKYDVLRSATITLVDAAQLDGLYDVVHGVLSGHLADAAGMDVSGLQVYHTSDVPQVFFDLKDMVNRLKNTDDALLETQLGKTVVYTVATTSFKDVVIDRNKYCGLSVYVPLKKWKENTEYQYYFESLEWGRIYD